MNCMSSLMFGSPDVLYCGYIYRFHLLPWHSPSKNSARLKRFLRNKSSFIPKVRLRNLPIEKHWIQLSGNVSFSTNATLFWSLYPEEKQIQEKLSQQLYTTVTTPLLILISDAIIAQTKSDTVCILMILSAAVHFWFVNSG